MLSGSRCAPSDRSRSTTAAFSVSSAGRPDHCASNHSHRRLHSSVVSDAWIRLSGFPGVRPRPAVLKDNEPSTACRGLPSPLRITTAPCGTGPSALRSSTVFLTQSAQRLANQRPCRRLRAARSPSAPNSPSSVSSGGRTRRAPAMRASFSASSPNAFSDSDPDAKSSRLPGRSHGSMRSTTRSVPVLETILIAMPNGMPLLGSTNHSAGASYDLTARAAKDAAKARVGAGSQGQRHAECSRMRPAMGRGESTIRGIRRRRHGHELDESRADSRSFELFVNSAALITFLARSVARPEMMVGRHDNAFNRRRQLSLAGR